MYMIYIYIIIYMIYVINTFFFRLYLEWSKINRVQKMKSECAQQMFQVRSSLRDLQILPHHIWENCNDLTPYNNFARNDSDNLYQLAMSP